MTVSASHDSSRGRRAATITATIDAVYGPAATSSDSWIWLPGKPHPDQGWKLHVSSAVTGAIAVLEVVLPVLRHVGVAAKVAATLAVLGELNEGWRGVSQIGKFITVYPPSDEIAVSVATKLDEATAEMHGPGVPSDRALRPGGLVHYRYGGFVDRPLRMPLGEIVSAISAPDGSLVPDRREPVYLEPEWVNDPFPADGRVQAGAPRSLLSSPADT